MTRPADFGVAQVEGERPGQPEAHTHPLLDQKNGDWDEPLLRWMNGNGDEPLLGWKIGDEPLLGSGNGGEPLLGWKNGNGVDDCAAAVVLLFLHSLH